MKSIVSSFLVAVILVGTLIVALGVEPGWASGTIYIRDTGDIDPPDAPISTLDLVTYYFTDNIYDSIVVERSSIIIDGKGYTVQGSGSGNGFYQSGINNVTVKNTNIKDFEYGIYLYSSSNNSIADNSIAGNPQDGILLESSNYNSISGNNVTNNWRGIRLVSSSSNSIIENNITNCYNAIMLTSSSSNNSIIRNSITGNSQSGIQITDSSYNSVSGNNITDNRGGIEIIFSDDNKVYHNNFINNLYQTGSIMEYNTWDDGYPSGGNYWSDHSLVDLYKGPYQNETGGDGVCDNPYSINPNNQDRYPVTKAFGGPVGDVDGDRKVDMRDIGQMARIFGVKYPDPRYDRLCDVDLDGSVDMRDIGAAARNFGKSW